MYITQDCEIKSEASHNADSLSEVKQGDSILVIAKTNTGYYALKDGGYIFTAYISGKISDDTSADTTSANSETTTAEVTTTAATPEVTTTVVTPEVTTAATSETTTSATTKETTTSATTKETTTATTTTTTTPTTTTTTPATTAPAVDKVHTAKSMSATEAALAIEVFELINEIRLEHGLATFTTTQELSETAQLRAEELEELYSHERPDGTMCFTAFDECGVKYISASENIAYGVNSLYTAEQVVEIWMNSPNHRASILEPKYKKLGVGCYIVGNTYYWTQNFTN